MGWDIGTALGFFTGLAFGLAWRWRRFVMERRDWGMGMGIAIRG
jgi:hypothetical protein